MLYEFDLSCSHFVTIQRNDRFELMAMPYNPQGCKPMIPRDHDEKTNFCKHWDEMIPLFHIVEAIDHVAEILVGEVGDGFVVERVFHDARCRKARNVILQQPETLA